LPPPEKTLDEVLILSISERLLNTRKRFKKIIVTLVAHINNLRSVSGVLKVVF